MKIIIDIPDKIFHRVCQDYLNYTETTEGQALKAISEGTPIPKGHGRIVDIGKIDEDRIDKDNPIIYLTVNGEYIEAVSLDYLNNLPPIVEADRKESDIKQSLNYADQDTLMSAT